MYVVKVLLESSFCHHVENRRGKFRHTFTDNHFHPSPLAANWPLIGTKLNCRQPLILSFVEHTCENGFSGNEWVCNE